MDLTNRTGNSIEAIADTMVAFYRRRGYYITSKDDVSKDEVSR